MPVTDPAGARARAEMLSRGWPDYTSWAPDTAALAQLAELTERRRSALNYEWRAVTAPAPPAVARTYDTLRRALVDVGLPQKLAEVAADFSSMVHLGGIVEVVRWTAVPKPAGWNPGQESPAS